MALAAPRSRVQEAQDEALPSRDAVVRLLGWLVAAPGPRAGRAGSS